MSSGAQMAVIVISSATGGVLLVLAVLIACCCVFCCRRKYKVPEDMNMNVSLIVNYILFSVPCRKWVEELLSLEDHTSQARPLQYEYQSIIIIIV